MYHLDSLRLITKTSVKRLLYKPKPIKKIQLKWQEKKK